MLWIGLTGGIASGKSTVSALLRARGFAVVDADHLARLAIAPGSPGFNELTREFGTEVLNPDGTLDRKKLGALVFANPSRLAKLESIIHPRVRALATEKRAALEASGARAAFYDVPLLFEKKMEQLFDRVVVVSCRPETQLKRLLERDRLKPHEAEQRLRAQLPMSEKTSRADLIVENEGTLEDLERAVERLITDLGID